MCVCVCVCVHVYMQTHTYVRIPRRDMCAKDTACTRRMAESWAQDYELPVLDGGKAQMVIISRDFEFVGGHVYSDTTPRAVVSAERAGDRQGQQAESGGGDSGGDGGGDLPEVGQLMFVGAGRMVQRGDRVRVHVSYGAQGLNAMMLPS